MDKIKKVSFQSKFHIKKQIIIIKNTLIIIEKISYAIIRSKSVIIIRNFFLSLTNIIFLNSYSKVYKIIIKFNNKNTTQIFNNQFPKNIIKGINQYINIKNFINIDILIT